MDLGAAKSKADVDDAVALEVSIDFGLINDATNGLTLLSPSDYDTTVNDISAWTTKNTTKFKLLDADVATTATIIAAIKGAVTANAVTFAQIDLGHTATTEAHSHQQD